MTVRGIDYVKSAERWQEYGRNYHKDGSIYYAEGIKALLTVTTFLVGFVGVILQLGNVLNGSIQSKVLIMIVLIASLISAISGILLFRKMNEFLNNAGSYYERLSENLFQWIFKNPEVHGDEYPKEIYTGIQLKPELKNTLSDVQLGSIIVAFVSLILFLTTTLFPINFERKVKVDGTIKKTVTKKIVSTASASLVQDKKIKDSSQNNLLNIDLLAKFVLFFISSLVAGFIGALVALWLDKVNSPKLDVIATEDVNISGIYGSEKLVPGRYKFFRLKVTNKPLNKLQSYIFSRQTALQLNALLYFKQINKTMKGRWFDTLELAYADEYNKVRLANFPDFISLYPGESKILDVFVKFESDNDAYGWNNEAYLNNNLWKTNKYKLVPGDYNIEVQIMGTNTIVKKRFIAHIDSTIEKTNIK